MSKTLAQVFASNPTTIVQDDDLFYLVQSPYTPGTDAGITGLSLKAAFGSGGTINPGLINQLAFYASSGSTISGLPTTNNGVLITSGVGVPSIATTLPSVVQGNITLLGIQSQLLNMGGFRITNMADGVAATDAATVGQVTAGASPLTTKGDLFTFTTVNARLPVAVGDGKILQVNSATVTGLAYSTPTYPSLSGTAGTILRSDGTNNVYSTSTFANTYAASSLLFSSGANTVIGLATANNGVLVTSNAGIPSILAGPGVTGQILQSNAAAAPSYSTATYPSTTTINQLLFSSAANTVTGLATANSSILITNGSGVPAWGTTLPAFTVTGNITFNPTTAGIAGTTTNNNASAGVVGEIVSSTILVGSAVALTNATAANITSISLTAGDWDVWGAVACAPAGTTTFNALLGWISTTSASVPTAPNEGAEIIAQFTFGTGGAQQFPVGMKRISLASTTTVFLSIQITFAVSTMSAYGYIAGRRRR